MSSRDRGMGQATPRGEEITVSSTLSKLWQGGKRTWKLYARSKMGILGLIIVLAFVFMAVFAPLISPYTPSFRAPSSDIFIADSANIGLPLKENWSTPMGLTTAATGNALKRIMVYAPETGDTFIYPVSPGINPLTHESGIIIGDPTQVTHGLPKNLSYIDYVKFPTPYPEPGNFDISGSFFFMLEGSVLHEYKANLVDSGISWDIAYDGVSFVPLYHSNLWNGYVPQTPTARLALAFANETVVWLLDMRPRISSTIPIATFTSAVKVPNGTIISSPIVMDTNDGGALAVPTDKALYVYALNYTNVTDSITHTTYPKNVTIGNLLWSTDYKVGADDFVAPIRSKLDATITFPNPTDATTLFGKTSILLATDDGRIVAYNTFNGTILWANRAVMSTIPSYTLDALFPAATGVTVVGLSGSFGFIATIDPLYGVVRTNQTSYSTTEGFINMVPNYIAPTKNFIYSTDRGIIYIADERMRVSATFTVPSGGMETIVAFLGNIYIADSQTGNYFGTITKENSLYIETISGVNIAPLPPGTYPSGNRYLLGTDYEGHDILSWLIYGTRSELLVGVTAAIFAVVIGTIVGLVAGYYSGLVDDLLMRATDVVLSLPFIVIALLFASVFGPLLVNIIIIIAVLSWAGIARVIRSVTLSLKERSFVDAAIIAGASESRLIFRHIAPNVLPYTFLYMTFTVSGAIITEAILAFLGFGDPTNVTWGMMLQFLQISGHSLDAPWWLLPPGIAITLLSLSFYLIGRAFDEVVNPRLRRR